MSRPRYWWDYTVKIFMRRYPDTLKKENTPQSKLALQAIDDTIEETKLLPDGDLRLKFLDLVYIRQIYTFNGGCLECHIGTTTASKWVSAFVWSVGEKMGFK